MKETKIAKKNIKGWEFTKPQDNELWRLNIYRSKCIEHKQTCQRWLKFLEEQEKCKSNLCSVCFKRLKAKIKDLKQAIKLYTDGGI